MTASNQLLDSARRCFRLAAEATEVECIARFAELGRNYLRMAHEDACIASYPANRERDITSR